MKWNENRSTTDDDILLKARHTTSVYGPSSRPVNTVVMTPVFTGRVGHQCIAGVNTGRVHECPNFFLNYCFAAVVLIATNKVEYITVECPVPWPADISQSFMQCFVPSRKYTRDSPPETTRFLLDDFSSVLKYFVQRLGWLVAVQWIISWLFRRCEDAP